MSQTITKRDVKDRGERRTQLAVILTRRKFLAASAAIPLTAISQKNSSPPNIVFIMADDLGYADLSCYGRRDYSMPNIDRLAAEGMKFTQAYANSSVCSPTRTQRCHRY